MTDGLLIVGAHVVRRWNAPATPPIADGALYVEAGRIVAIGPRAALEQRYPAARRIGDAHQLVVPGFVNAHAHGRGLTTLQMGQADEPLEPRIAEFVLRREVAGADPYRDTLYACAKQIAAGVTTTVHSHQYMDGPVEPFVAGLRPILDAYRDSGLRCAFTVGIRDRTEFSVADDPGFLATLPAASRAALGLRASQCVLSLEQYAAALRELQAAYPTIVLQLGPWNPVFCSDALLRGLADLSARDGWRIQTHLVETRHQAAYGRRLHNTSWVRHLDALGLLSPRFSGAHGVWLDDGDIEILARSGAQIVHNPGSNLRLRSGIAKLRAMLEGGIKMAFGLDSLSINDDDDMLQDLRVGRLVQGSWGIDGDAIAAEVLLEMATATGAVVAGTPGGGVLAEGGPADVVLLDLAALRGAPGPSVGDAAELAETLLTRGRAAHVRSVVIGGRVMIEAGRWSGLTPGDLLAELASSAAPAHRLDAPAHAVKTAVRAWVRDRAS
ncbi:MAG: amidohydrolase family protein [Alphaproteobacteria bacterium]|nr:amidohydrolase family protein [Alphaproteobacteria bacterium]